MIERILNGRLDQTDAAAAIETPTFKPVCQGFFLFLGDMPLVSIPLCEELAVLATRKAQHAAAIWKSFTGVAVTDAVEWKRWLA